jgi:hypothetical protein
VSADGLNAAGRRHGGTAAKGVRSAAARDRGGRLLSTPAAESHSGLPASLLRRLVVAGKLRVVCIPGSKRFWFRREDLDAAIEEWTEVRA